MSRRKTALLVLLAAAVATGMILPVSALTGPSSTAERPATTQQSSERVSPEVGQQLSTVVVATTEEVRTEADDAAFEQQFNDTNATERAEAVAERAGQFDQRASTLRSEYQSLTESYRNGEIDGSTYAQELATLAARASALNSSVDALEDRAGELSDAERRAVDVTDEDLQAISAQLDPVSGSTAAAVLSQFTGEARGEIELEVDGGIALEVSSEDGEQSRQFERPRDGNGTLVLTQSEARSIATDALSQQDGEWVLTSVGTDDGAYEFEFDLHGPTEAEGEAEVAVDGETGTVFELEESVEFEEEDDDDDDEAEREDDQLALRVIDGESAPGATVTLSATQGGEAVENASVAVNEETVGTTDANGTLTVTFPESEEVKIKTTAGEAEGELEYEFEDDDDEEELGATADISNGTVTVSVVLGDQPVEGASVTANGESVGQTDANGTVTFPLPDGDELDIEITDGDREAELEYEFENEEEGADDEEEDEREEDEGEDDETDEDEEEGDDDTEEEDDEQEDGADEEAEADEESDDEESDDDAEEDDAEDEADEESDDDDAEDEESDDDDAEDEESDDDTDDDEGDD